MSNSRHQNFRTFLTERFTAVAVEVFGEVEAIVESYYEENKRLRNVLHMVLGPDIKLPKIDHCHHTAATTSTTHQPFVQPRDENMDISEYLQPKTEQEEYDISCELPRQQVLEEADNLTISDCVKRESDAEDSSMPPITDSHNFEIVVVSRDSSGTISANEENDNCDVNHSMDSDGLVDFQEPSKSDESASKSVKSRNHKKKSKNKGGGKCAPKQTEQPLQKTVLELPRIMPHHSVIPTPSASLSLLSRITEAFKDLPEDKKPLITKIGFLDNMESVDCAFGKVPKGSPLSYQCPVPSDMDYEIHDDVPPRPPLPSLNHKLEPMLDFSSFSLSTREQEHINTMGITLEDAQCLESSTRPPNGHKERAEQLLKLRLTCRFREICNLKPGRSNAEHLIFRIQRGGRICKNLQIEEEMKTEALREYCSHVCVNWSPCGYVVHPNAPWLGALPHGLVYDPNERPTFGLVHVKCIHFKSFISCKFFTFKSGVLQLMKAHALYWDIQGEMMITGMSWCDLVVFSNEDILVQRIYRDESMISSMKKKLDSFFFYYYLPSLE
ncbi:uncharacterized protein LOC117815809 [Xyrichtys novacula]|uniref:Uncharacterized protein LOC117815809 n=1 Tax=Xyrichtys novacula TaxID=13765 RepID=A0AAV1ES51_XYRNO|nr:uncharacterized protein LOC117815809 [Xyrichtys novacula]